MKYNTEVEAWVSGPESELWREFQNNHFASNVNILPCLPFISSQDAADIMKYVLESPDNKGEICNISAINKYGLWHFVYGASFVLHPSNGRFLDEKWSMFVVIVASYVVSKKGTYLDLVRILGGDLTVERVPKSYMSGGGRKVSIGMVCKLLGLGQFGNMKKIDCPRVWDLETDEVVDNPNFRNDPVHQIAAITHRWLEKEFVYADLLEIKRANVILKKFGQPLESTKISSMSDKLAKIREELKSTIRYIWMDTLCIDKTNSTELDMSIRSMYRWYSSASFVYLEYFTDFREWCTRGWTLQEGAAARILRASPRHGNFMQLVAGMDDSAAYNLGLDEQGHRDCSSIYWIRLMESRQTTMIEDKAYALIGLLGIDFQIAYGEGERAIDRMCEQLAKQRGDISWLAGNKLRHRTDEHLTMEELSYCRHSDLRHEIQITSAGMRLEVIRLEKPDLAEVSGRKLCKRFTYGESLGLMRYLALDDDDSEISKMYCWIPSNNILLELDEIYGPKKKMWRIMRARLVDLDWKENLKERMTVVVRHKD